MTQGHNIVADGWAGASNPHPHPTPIHKKHLKCSLSHFSTTDRRTDQRTDQRTDKASYKVACPQLKRVETRECLKLKKRQNKRNPWSKKWSIKWNMGQGWWEFPRYLCEWGLCAWFCVCSACLVCVCVYVCVCACVCDVGVLFFTSLSHLLISLALYRGLHVSQQLICRIIGKC